MKVSLIGFTCGEPTLDVAGEAGGAGAAATAVDDGLRRFNVLYSAGNGSQVSPASGRVPPTP